MRGRRGRWPGAITAGILAMVFSIAAAGGCAVRLSGEGLRDPSHAGGGVAVPRPSALGVEQAEPRASAAGVEEEVARPLVNEPVKGQAIRADSPRTLPGLSSHPPPPSSRPRQPTVKVTMVAEEAEDTSRGKAGAAYGTGRGVESAPRLLSVPVIVEAPRQAKMHWVVMSRYREPWQADELVLRVRSQGFPARSSPLTIGGVAWYGVSVGPYTSEQEAVTAGQGLRARGYAAWLTEDGR